MSIKRHYKTSLGKTFLSILTTFVVFLIEGMTGRTAVRMFLVYFWLSCGALLGGILSGFLNITRWVTVPTGILIVLLLMWAVMVGRLLLFFPLPLCRRGKCRELFDYRWKVGSIFGREKWGIYSYKCECGDSYVRHGRRFMLLNADGTKCPYKKLIGFRTWIDDSDLLPN